ncbi:MAG: hypothetical protein ACO3LM_03450, partial [Steroidobacteraceae bacterium]
GRRAAAAQREDEHDPAQVHRALVLDEADHVAAECARELLQHLESRGILGGIDYSRFDPTVDNQLLVAVTERHSKADLDRMVAAVHTALGELA